MCRQCTDGKWDSVIGFIARRDQLDPKRHEDLAEICRRAVGDVPTTHSARVSPPPIPPYAAPESDWQSAAQQVIAECEAALWQPKYARVLDYLRGRGLAEETLRHFRLGYCATGKPDLYGREIAGLYVPRGLVIPCVVASTVWYLKIRLVPGVLYRCQGCQQVRAAPGRCGCGKDNRYLGVKGNRPAAIYNADALIAGQPGMALFCEGEFDCMTAWQEFRADLPAATIGGSATNRLDLATWGAYLMALQSILVTYDADPAGENGAAWLMKLSDRVKLSPLPEGVKDLNAYHQQGGDLRAWVRNYLAFYGGTGRG
jgi:DNA primase